MKHADERPTWTRHSRIPALYSIGLLTTLMAACSAADSNNPPGPDQQTAGSTSGGDTAQAGAGGAAGSGLEEQVQGGSGGAQTQAGAGGSTAGTGGASESQGGTGGTSQEGPATPGEMGWHCIGTMQQAACSCVLASTEPVAPYESGCPNEVQYVCCYTSETLNPDDACSCWTESGLEQLGQTCEQLLQLVESAGAARVDSCSND